MPELFDAYETASGVPFFDTTSPDPRLGKTFYDIISKYPEVNDLIKELYQLETVPPAVLGDELSIWDNQDIADKISSSIDSLEDLVYITGTPFLYPNDSAVFGEYRPRSTVAAPDTVLFTSPTEFQYTDKPSWEIPKEEGLETLIHEGLLHGTDLRHPTDSAFAHQQSSLSKHRLKTYRAEARNIFQGRES